MKAFECKQCGACCQGEGGIHVRSDEAETIAHFLGISAADFLLKWCFFRHSRYYIITGSDGFCAFFDPQRQCTIHPVKPRPCSLWPFYPALLRDPDNWNMAKEACSGINPCCSFEQFRRQSRE